MSNSYDCCACPMTIHPHHARVSFEGAGGMLHFHVDCYHAAVRSAGGTDIELPVVKRHRAPSEINDTMRRRMIADAETLIGSD